MFGEGRIQSVNVDLSDSIPDCSSQKFPLALLAFSGLRSGRRKSHFLWTDWWAQGSCQVPEEVRVILISLQVVKRDQVFDPFLDGPEVRL